MHVDLWAATELDGGAAAASVRGRRSALSPFYRYCAAPDLIGRVPTQGVARPAVDPDYTATAGLNRDQARALAAAADADTGTQALRTAAAVRLLLHNALRVDEACAADVADLGEDSGHRAGAWSARARGGRISRSPRPPWRPWRQRSERIGRGAASPRQRVRWLRVVGENTAVAISTGKDTNRVNPPWRA